MGAEQELFTDASMTGLDRKVWHSNLYKRFAFDFFKGDHSTLGQHIKIAKNKRILHAKLSKKATVLQLNKFIAFCESTCPSFYHCRIALKNRRMYEKLKFRSWDDLNEFIQQQLQTRSNIQLKIEW